jgi:hypothetical protein
VEPLHPIVAQAQAAAANPGFRLTSWLEFVAGIGKTFIDTPEERQKITDGLMMVYDTFVVPRAPLVAKPARPFAEQFVKSTLEQLAS